MSNTRPDRGYFACGLPYNRSGHGPRPLVVFQGLMLENKPQPNSMVSFYRCLEQDYTIWNVLRKPGLPQGYTLRDMSDDYAALVVEEFGGPVDLIGVSTGGSLALNFAADHPGLLRRLVVHSAAHSLSPSAKALQLEIARLASLGQWRKVYALLLGAVLPPAGLLHTLSKPLVWFGAPVAAWLGSPKDPSDLIVTVEAEDRLAFIDRLGEIQAPTLVAGGELDPFYTPQLFRETAAGIPNARLALYAGVGHPASGKQFERDLRAFLLENA